MAETFDEWMVRVDNVVGQATGLSIHDLPDVCLADWFEDGFSPAQAAKLALMEACS